MPFVGDCPNRAARVFFRTQDYVRIADCSQYIGAIGLYFWMILENVGPAFVREADGDAVDGGGDVQSVSLLRLHGRQHLIEHSLRADDVAVHAQLIRRDADREADELRQVQDRHA